MHVDGQVLLSGQPRCPEHHQTRVGVLPIGIDSESLRAYAYVTVFRAESCFVFAEPKYQVTEPSRCELHPLRVSLAYVWR